jgi:hypothetical protein
VCPKVFSGGVDSRGFEFDVIIGGAKQGRQKAGGEGEKFGAQNSAAFINDD